MSTPTRGYAQRIDIQAPAALAWEALTVQAHLRRWMGGEACIRGTAGGHWCVTPLPGLVREALIDVFEPPRRLRLIYLPPASEAPFEGVMVDDFLLEEDGGRTILRLLGSGYPDVAAWDGYFRKVRASQERALARLKIVAERLQGRIMAGAGPSAR